MDSETAILIATITAVSAIGGALVPQLVSFLRDNQEKKHQRFVLLRQKYEELAYLVSDSQRWINDQMNADSATILKSNPPIMARKAMVLSHVYFPKLQDACQDYLNSCVQFQIILIKNHEFRNGIDAGTQAIARNQDEVLTNAKQLHDRKQRVEEEIITFAKEYAKA